MDGQWTLDIIKLAFDVSCSILLETSFVVYVINVLIVLSWMIVSGLLSSKVNNLLTIVYSILV